MTRTRDRLDAVDQRILGAPAPTTLCPGRDRATPARQVIEHLDLDEDMQDALTEGLAGILESWTHHFPNNLFWDVELLAESLSRAGSPAECQTTAGRVADLARGFGRSTKIRFQYVHDFLYGFDWARWVARDPEERDGVGPFEQCFLAHLELRQVELLELIDHDDQKYPRLVGPGHRNPFGFARDPASEAQLHLALAKASLVPVEAWSFGGRATWDRPFARLREELAKDLGLGCP
ncbi:MAG: ferrochelatase [Myxococcales bacterium]|nr:ferrochelatase [Myxococcales bacterium]